MVRNANGSAPIKSCLLLTQKTRKIRREDGFKLIIFDDWNITTKRDFSSSIHIPVQYKWTYLLWRISAIAQNRAC